MAGFGPITKNLYTITDPREKAKEKEPFYNTYEIFLYGSVTKGSMPLYKVICNNKDFLISKVNELKEKFNFKTPGSILTRTSNYYQDIYEIPIVLDVNTGEIFAE